ncbi:MAG: ABC transporter substrate-binding protein [Clostridia bacterium]|nr:ABC transporter substrate-binding protein [Clostridia bacterium]
MKKILILLMVLILSFTLLSCEKETEKEEVVMDNITVTLDWTPNTNHTGLYVALEKGYFDEEGLSVEIIQPSNGTAEAIVATEQAQFGISYQEAVTLARIEELPIVSIGAIIQHNSSGFASVVSKGIKSPKDFENKNYGGWGSPIENAMIQALVEQDGGDFSKVNILTSGAADFFAASEADVDFAWIFEGWTGVEAELKGIELDYIDLGKSDEALDYYTPVIITSETLIKDNPEMVKKFMAAVAKGYEYAINQPTDAAHILLKYAPELDEALVVKSQEFLATRYQDDAAMWGLQEEVVWKRYMDWLFERHLIESTIDVNKAFTNDFLPEEK